MNALTRFEIVRRVLGHDILVPLSITETLTIKDFRGDIIKYGLHVQDALQTTPYDPAAGVTTPSITFIGVPEIRHVTCTGNTTYTVTWDRLAKTALLHLHRTPTINGAPPMDINQPRDAYLVLLANTTTNVPGMNQYNKMVRQEEACLRAAKGFTFPHSDEVVKYVQNADDDDPCFDVTFLKQWAATL